MLLYRKDNKIVAHGLAEQKDLWTWTSPGGSVQFEKLWPGSKDQSGKLVLRNDQSLYCLDAQTGAACWRCDVPKQDNVQIGTDLIYPLHSKTPPLLLSQYQNRPGTIAQRFLPTQANGRYQPAEPAPLTYSGLGKPEYRSLPWAWPRNGYPGAGQQVDLAHVISFIGFVMALVYWGAKGRWRRVVVFSSLALVLTITAALWLVYRDLGPFGPNQQFTWGTFEPNERYSWEGWYWILFMGGSLGFLPIFWWMILSAVVRVGRWFSRSGRRVGEPGA